MYYEEKAVVQKLWVLMVVVWQKQSVKAEKGCPECSNEKEQSHCDISQVVTIMLNKKRNKEFQSHKKVDHNTSSSGGR